jgi:hypothetical protein
MRIQGEYTAQSWTPADSARAHELWAEYQTKHDLTDRLGQAAGADPRTGDVWFGESAKGIWLALRDQGIARPLYYFRVGQPTYGMMRRR